MKRIAIIGLGGIANAVHIPSLKELPDARVAAVCDLESERAKAGAACFGLSQWYDNYRTLLRKETIDGAFVLAWPDQTYRIAQDCMRAGVDVFCEKPAGITMFQLESLKRTQQETGALLQIGFNRRYIPLIRTVFDKMAALAPLTQINGCFYKNGEAAFYDGCASSLECDVIHVADLLCAAAGCDVQSVQAMAGRVNSPVDNAWNAVFRYENGILGNIRTGYQTGGRTHSFELHSPKASAYINIGFGTAACEADIIYFGGTESHSMASTGVQDAQIEHLDGLALADSSDYHRYYGYYDEDAAFIQSMHTRVAAKPDIDDAIRAMKLIDAIRESARNHSF